MSDQNESLTVALLLRVMTANRFRRSLKKSNWAKGDWAKSEGSNFNLLFWLHRGGNCGKNVKKHMKNMVFYRIACFLEQFTGIQANHWHLSFLKKLKAIRSRSLFWKEWWERFAKGLSFEKNDESDSLKVSLLKRAMRAIRSRSLFLKQRWQRIAHSRTLDQQEWKSEIPTLSKSYLLKCCFCILYVILRLFMPKMAQNGATEHYNFGPAAPASIPP